ncbi:DUF4142 domain-containing protein [Actinomadura algeriensis]|uniref:Membrane protein n=1 Tax=Actinomadura algeriensis TaxID=1679523 RepID=A0ABR9JZX4_9ACTN|nr:DUF4142 domain-containing protein [Actinomadura algeriensis]MBE1536023.1 putative membrane protein [Actinomadura algeriensis]
MMRTRPLTAVLAAAVAVAAPVACTDTADVRDVSGQATVPAGKVSEQDKGWMRRARRIDLAAVNAGDLAQRRGTTREVRTLGATIAREHRALDARLVATARRLGVELPHATSDRKFLEIDGLKDRRERLFDLNWTSVLTDWHEEGVEAAKAEIAQGSSPEVIVLARDRLRVLERHLAALDELGTQEMQGG